MATTQSSDVQPGSGRAPAASEGSAAAHYGWVAFAAITATLAGTFNVIDGIVALTSETFFRPTAHYVFSDLTTWGWFLIVTGCVELAAAAALGTGSELARWICIGAVSLNAIVQLLAIQAYPAWSIAVFALDVLVIYALTMYAGSRLHE